MTRTYTAPLNSSGKVNLSDKIISFDDPNPNTSTDRYLTLTPINSTLHVDNMYIQPNIYFTIVQIDTNGVFKSFPFDLDTGKSITVQLRFTQGSTKLYQQASLIVEGSPCPPQVPLIGGLYQLTILQPNGGEVYSSCDSILIIWGGIEPDKPVNLYYSSDDGITWINIVNNVTGLSYHWFPPKPGTMFKIKGSVLPDSDFIWAINEGGIQYDAGTSLAMDNYYCYVTGYFSGVCNFSGKNITSR